MFKVIVADTQPVFRAGVATVLSSDTGFQVVQQCADWKLLREAVARHPFALILASTWVVDSLSSLLALAHAAGSRILLVVEDTESTLRYAGSGVAGMLRRSSDLADVLNHARCIQRGASFVAPAIAAPVRRDLVGTRAAQQLTRSELRIVCLLLEGMKNREIAHVLRTTEQVVKNYLRSVFDKVGVSDRVELALYTFHHPAFQMAAADISAGISIAPASPLAMDA
jgi:DNA-binding NarL/FixJ family response regulator